MEARTLSQARTVAFYLQAHTISLKSIPCTEDSMPRRPVRRVLLPMATEVGICVLRCMPKQVVLFSSKCCKVPFSSSFVLFFLLLNEVYLNNHYLCSTPNVFSIWMMIM